MKSLGSASVSAQVARGADCSAAQLVNALWLVYGGKFQPGLHSMPAPAAFNQRDMPHPDTPCSCPTLLRSPQQAGASLHTVPPTISLYSVTVSSSAGSPQSAALSSHGGYRVKDSIPARWGHGCSHMPPWPGTC
jgi:hypothetical protein